MSANDDVNQSEILDAVETAISEPGAPSADAGPAPRAYQNLFRAVCLKDRKSPPASA